MKPETISPRLNFTHALELDMKGSDNRLLSTILVAFLCLTYLLVGLSQVNQATEPTYDNTARYLEKAVFFEDHGGLLNFVNLCLTGQYKATEQHPLYPLLLAPFASRQLSFFPTARLVSLMVGFCVVVTLFFTVRGLYGPAVAYTASLLLVFNSLFLEMSSHVECESILILFAWLSVYFMVKGIDSPRFFLWAGLACGLAYLTKGTGLLFVPVYIAAGLFVHRLRILRLPQFWLFFVAFAVVTAPYTVRNIAVFGNPFYEDLNSRAPWLDSWEDMWDPKYQVTLNWQEQTWSVDNLPTLGSYLRTHSLREVASRLVKGSIGEAGDFVRSMDLVFVNDGRNLWRMCSVGFIIFGLLTEGRKARVVLVTGTALVFFLPLAWLRPVGPYVRYLAPLVPILCVYCASGMVRFLEHLGKPVVDRYGTATLATGLRVVLIAVLAVFCVSRLATETMHLPAESPLFSSEEEEGLYRWLGTNVREDDVVIMGPRTGKFLKEAWGDAFWQTGFKGSMVMFTLPGRLPVTNSQKDSLHSLPHDTAGPIGSAHESISALNAYLRKLRVSLIVRHKDNFFYPSMLREYFDYSEANGIRQLHEISGWSFVYKSEKHQPSFMVFRTNST